MRHLLVAAIALACMNAPAFASHREHHQTRHHEYSNARHHGYASARHHGRRYAGLRRAWCGASMRQVFGISDARLNLARNWAGVGSNAGGPQVGAVVVWPHHVGVIRGGPDGSGQWLVESGNDGNAVRTRYRSLHGAIAFRSVNRGFGFAGGGGYAPAATGQAFGWQPYGAAAVANKRSRQLGR